MDTGAGEDSVTPLDTVGKDRYAVSTGTEDDTVTLTDSDTKGKYQIDAGTAISADPGDTLNVSNDTSGEDKVSVVGFETETGDTLD